MATGKDKPHHIGKNGPAPCTAEPGHCPLGGESGSEDHFPDYATADKAFGEQNKDKQFATHSRKSVENTPKLGESAAIPARHSKDFRALPGIFSAHKENFEGELSYDDDPWGEGEAMGWGRAYEQYNTLCASNLYQGDGTITAENVQNFISSMQERIAQIEDTPTGSKHGDKEKRGRIAAMQSSVAMAEEALSKARDSWQREKDTGKGAVEMAALSQRLKETKQALGNGGEGDDGSVEAMNKYGKVVESVVNEYNQTGRYNDGTMAKAIATLEKAQSRAQRASAWNGKAKDEAASLGTMVQELKNNREAALADNPAARKARDAMEDVSTLSRDTRQALGSMEGDSAIDESRRIALERVNNHVALIEKEFQATGEFPDSAVERAIIDLERNAPGNQGAPDKELSMRGAQALKAAQRRNVAPNAEEAMNQLSIYAAKSREEVDRAYQDLGLSRSERLENMRDYDYSYRENTGEINEIVNAYQHTGEFNQESLNSAIARVEKVAATTKGSITREINNDHLEKLRSIRSLSQAPRSSTPATKAVPLSQKAIRDLQPYQEALEKARGNVEEARAAMENARRAEREAANHFILGRDRKVREAREKMNQASQALQSADAEYISSSTGVNGVIRKLRTNMNINGEVTMDGRGNYFINNG